MRGFLVGAMLGAVAAVLLAPRRGEETRDILRTRAEEWQGQATARLDQARSEVDTLRTDMVSRLEQMKGQVATRQEKRGRTRRPAASERHAAAPPEGM